MSKPFNPAYIRGATNDQLKTSLLYKPYLKMDEEIDGVRGFQLPEPILLGVVETRENDEKNNVVVQ